ncbi:FAD-binding protein [Nocardia pseudovaccinii]|uniref:FAD-binding protein n=1 Tax=Nocardia pseudovaccinii TaxID=189540 RepID=UPI0007A3B659|nr:FAD-binding protein [Nocardia pseudovaccinii]
MSGDSVVQGLDPNGVNEVDVIVVGSGCGGLIAGLAAKAAGLNPIVLEKSGVAGGTTAYSHGAVWVPDNPLMRRAGVKDSVEDGVRYLQDVVGDQGPATSITRQEAYVRGGSRMLEFLLSEGVPLAITPDYPDYHPEAVGSHTQRIVGTPWLDARELGAWQDLPRPRPDITAGMVLASIPEFRSVLNAGVSWEARFKALGIAARTLKWRLAGVKPLIMGQSYIGHLLKVAQRRDLRIALNSSMRELISENGRVTGVIVDQPAGRVAIRARYGVLLASGGFSRNLELRQKFGPHPASTDWTAVNEGDTGDAFLAATALGAATANLDKAFYLPGLMDKDGVCQIFISERVVPGSILVDRSGARFANEAQSYMTLGNEQYARQQTVPAVPAYLIIDAEHRRKWPLGQYPPMVPPRAWLKSGHLVKAGSLRELAIKCGVDPDGLIRTVERFNKMAVNGVDEDFGRGDNAYDRAYGDPTHKGPNPCLGPIEKAPFYAAKMFPTDVGMAGGLLTDEFSRVVGENGAPIEGLYACGTAAASCMGDKYPGGGISLGQSSTFGYIAAEQFIERAKAPKAPVRREKAGR